MLEIKNLHVKLEEEEKQILKGVDLTVEAGKVHAIMGPNGSGKSTLSYVLSGRDGYEVTDGSASLAGDDILDMEPEERAAAPLQPPTDEQLWDYLGPLLHAYAAHAHLRGREAKRAQYRELFSRAF